MKDLTPAAWRRKIEKEIGKKIPDLVWGWITTSEERKHIKQANAYEAGAPDMGLSYLIEEVNYAIEGYEHNQLNLPPQITSPDGKQEKPKKDEKDKSPREIKPDKRFRALSDIIAFLAGRDEDIKAFRLEALQGQLLQPEEVPAWIKATRDREGYTLPVTLNIASGANWEDRLIQQAQRIAAFSRNEEGSEGERFRFKGGSVDLGYIKPGSEWAEYIPINVYGILGDLKKLAKKYEAFWPEAWAVQFILTGKAPPIEHARVGHKINSHGFNKITLEVSPHLSGDRVKALYLREKKKSFRLIGKGGQSRTRRINDKYLALAVFAAKEYSLKVKNVQLLRLWNRKHRRQGWDYEEPQASNFARDCRAAFERITGWKWEDCFKQ